MSSKQNFTAFKSPLIAIRDLFVRGSKFKSSFTFGVLSDLVYASKQTCNYAFYVGLRLFIALVGQNLIYMMVTNDNLVKYIMNVVDVQTA